MTTNLIVRRAKDISCPNEIANFGMRYSINCVNVSAVSWELPGSSRREAGEVLLKKMIRKINPGCSNIHVMVELSPEQPNSVIVKYKKVWGLLKDDGICVDKIENKISFERKGSSGLILSSLGSISVSKDNVISDLINEVERAYFAIGDDIDICSSFNKPIDWMKCVWNNGGVVFMLLGYFDEPACEVVAMGYAIALTSVDI